MLECFWDLVSSEPVKRQEAEYTLLTSLRAAQANHPKAGLAPDVDYAVKRLVRGLSSSTEAARQGFAACLSEALHALPEIPLSTVYDYMTESTEVTGSVRGQEERDMLFGRLFTCLVVARSGRLKQEPQDVDVDGTSAVCCKLFESALSIFAKRKVLRTLAAEALVAMLHDMPPDAFLQDDGLAVKLTEALGGVDVKVQDYSPDQLLVALEVQKYLARHGMKKKEGPAHDKVPAELLGKVLCKPKRVSRLIEPLKASSSSFPHVHPVWVSLLEQVLGEGWQAEGVLDLSPKREEMLSSLWTTVVEGCLAVGTEERKALCLFLLQRLAPHLPSSALSLVLSPRLLHCLTTVLASNSPDQHLKPLAAHALDQIITAVLPHPDRRLALACSLLSRGDVNFDKRTNTKAVSRLTESLETEAVESFVRWLSQLVGGQVEVEMAEGEDEDAEVKMEKDAKRRAWAVDGLYALAKNSVMDEGVLRRLLRLLLCLGFFDASKVQKQKNNKKGGKKGGSGPSDVENWILVTTPDLPKEVRSMSATRFLSLMADLTTGPLVFQSAPTKGSLDWLWAAHESWKELEEAGAVLLEDIEEEDREAREKMLVAVEGIRTRIAGGEGDKAGAAIAALLMQVGLQQLMMSGGEEVQTCGEMLLDLCKCYELLSVGPSSEGKKGRKKRSKEEGEEDGEEGLPDPLTVLADVCVGALSLQGNGTVIRGMRDVVKKAWALVCGSKGLNRAAVEVIIQAVCPPATTAEDDDDDLIELEDEDEDEEGSDSGEEEEEMKGGSTPDKSKSKADQGLKGKSRGKQEEEEDGGEEEDIMLSLDDEEELLRVLGGDNKEEEGAASLQNILSLRQQSRKAGKLEAEKVRLQHRLRCLDLLEAFATRQHASGLLLLSLLPALSAVRSFAAQNTVPEAQALAKRLSTYITKTLGGKARPKVGEVTMEEVKEIALTIASRLSKPKVSVPGYGPLLTCAMACCLRAALSDASAGNESSHALPDWLGSLYQSALHDFMTKHQGPPPSLFDDFILRFPTPACQALLTPLTRSMAQATKSFRRAEACRLLSSLLSKRKSLTGPALEELSACLSPITEGLAKALSREEEGEQAGKAKRVKPVVQCAAALVATLQDTKLLPQAGRVVPPSTLGKLADALQKAAEITQSDTIKKMCATLVGNVRKLGGGKAGGGVASSHVGQKIKEGEGEAGGGGSAAEEELHVEKEPGKGKRKKAGSSSREEEACGDGDVEQGAGSSGKQEEEATGVPGKAKKKNKKAKKSDQ